MNFRQTLRCAIARQASTVRAWRTLLALLLCIVTWLALTPAPPPSADLGWDKLNHIAAFAALAAAAFLGYGGAWRRIAMALLGYGAMIEVLQSFTSARSSDAADLLADGLGIACGLVLAAAAVRAASRPLG